MATSPSTRLSSPVQSLSTNVSSILAWTLLKRLCGHERGFFDEGQASLPQGPVRLPAGVVEGQDVRHG